MRGRVVVASALLVCWLLLGSVAFVAPASAATIEVNNTLAQTSQDGIVDVKTQLRVPSGTASLEMTIPENTEVYEMEGFTHQGGNTYKWTGTTNRPYLRYHQQGNVTVTRNGDDSKTYVVTDDWAIVKTPLISLQWTGIQADVERNQQVDGEGVAGQYITYLGPYEERSRTASGQRFRMVIPERANLREDPSDIFDSMTHAAKRLEIGQRDDEVLVIVAPSKNVDWAATGVQRGDADMWVRDVERLDTSGNTWIHEYVHTRQAYERTEKTRWTIEGMANYYAALLTYEQGRIDFEAFRNRMERGTRDEYSDVRLTDPSTWESNRGNYDKGALVFGYLDRKIRAQTDRSLDTALAQVNQPGEKLTQAEFLDAIEAAGGGDIRADAEQYTETTDTPPLWSQSEHAQAFGGPNFRYEFTSYSVSGPYRETTLDSPNLVTGETLETTVQVTNVGTETGSYDVAFTVDGTRLDSTSGTLDPDESKTVTFEHGFETAGEYDLAVGTAATTVTVQRPADVTVTGLSVDPTSAAIGERVTLRAVVEPTADRPAEGEVTFTVDGDPVATEQVRIGGASGVVEATTTFDESGEYVVRAGDHSATVTVRDETVEPGDVGDGAGATPTGGTGAGLGAVPALVALVAVLLALGRGRR